MPGGGSDGFIHLSLLENIVMGTGSDVIKLFSCSSQLSMKLKCSYV